MGGAAWWVGEPGRGWGSLGGMVQPGGYRYRMKADLQRLLLVCK